jgi:hypothetical protein
MIPNRAHEFSSRTIARWVITGNGYYLDRRHASERYTSDFDNALLFTSRKQAEDYKVTLEDPDEVEIVELTINMKVEKRRSNE